MEGTNEISTWMKNASIESIVERIGAESPMISFMLLDMLKHDDEEKFLKVVKELKLEPDCVEKIKLNFHKMSV